MRKGNESSSESINQNEDERIKVQSLSLIEENMEEEVWSAEREFSNRVSAICVGKKVGRPRKLPRNNTFFDYSRSNKKE